MSSRDDGQFWALPTPLKILLIISLALLPLGLASAWVTKRNLDTANSAVESRGRDRAQVVVESLRVMLARQALATRIAGNAALPASGRDPCAEVQRILAISPAEVRNFDLIDGRGQRICAVGDMPPFEARKTVAPGDTDIWVPETDDALLIRAGVIGGQTTTRIALADFAEPMKLTSDDVEEVTLIAGGNELHLREVDHPGGRVVLSIPFRSPSLVARVAVALPTIGWAERLMIFLPVIMWAAAALISWWMVHRLLIRPLRRLQGAVSAYQPGDDAALVMPPGLGPAREIHELGESFQRAVIRIDSAEKEAREALDGQRRLVREVHHRVKNNLQVVASLLSIHGRTAVDPEAKAAYAAIGRRVDALSVVHRNHYAELEENRGIALRPLLTELSAGLRASAPVEARAMPFELEVDIASTTQDVAVAAAFLVTEIVEFAMLREPHRPVRIAVRRAGDLTATLAIESAVLRPDTDDDDDQSRVQFERVVEGLSRQLRSPLDRRLGRYAVTLPIFPDR